MPIDIISLPPNMHDAVFVFLTDRSLLRLREVSKSAKEIVECSIVKTRKTEINSFQVIPNEANHSMTLYFEHMRDFSLWKINMKYLFDKLGIVGLEIGDEYTEKVLQAKLSTEDIARLFTSLKPLIQLTDFDALCLSIQDSDIMGMCTTFFLGKIIQRISVNAADISENSPLLYLMRKVDVNHVECVIIDFPEKFEQCLQLTDLVNSLCLIVHSENFNDPRREIISIIRQILKRKCEFIHFFFASEDCFLLAEAESLITTFHHSGKTVKFTATTIAEPMDVQIGEYLMTIDSGRFSNLEIKHMNWKFTSDKMTINILNLPSNIFVRIFEFVDDKSFMRLREVRKSAKNLVDFSILKTRNTIIKILSVEEAGTKLSFYFNRRRDFSLWKRNLNYFMANFSMAELQSYDVNRHLIIDVSSDYIQEFLASLYPFIQRTTFLRGRMKKVSGENIKYYSNFFTGKYIRQMSIFQLTAEELRSHLALIKQLRTETVRCAISYSVDVEEVASQLADLVKSLSILVLCPRYSNEPQEIVSFVRNMLGRKCAKLDFNASYNRSISLVEAETLLHLFHRSGKQVRFSTAFKEDEFSNSMNFQIGEYNVKIYLELRKIIVNHLQFERIVF